MKFLLLLMVVIVAAAAGYMFEPKLRMSLTGKPANFDKASAKLNPKPENVGKLTPEPVTPVEKIPTPVIPAPVPTTPEISNPNPATDPTPEVVDVVPPSPPSEPSEPVEPVEPEVTNAPETPETPVQQVDVVAVMKASLAAGEISKFSARQVLELEAAASPETIDGEIYQIGNLKYQTETPFGTKNLPAKALIKNGKVVRWISPKSGMQIE